VSTRRPRSLATAVVIAIGTMLGVATVTSVLGCGEEERGGGAGGGGHRGHASGGTASGTSPRRHGSDIARGTPAEEHGTAPDRAPARVARFTGEVARSRGPLDEGADLERGDGLVVRGDGSADVDLRDGGRVSLDRDTEIRIGDGGPAQIVLVRGALHAVVPPGPAGPRPPLRIATPSASVDLAGSGELYVIAHASGATWVVGLGGLTTVVTGEVDGRRRLRVVELVPSRAVLVAARMAEPTDGPARLDEARTAAAALLESAAPLEAERATRDLGELATRLDESLLWLETEGRRGRDLTTQHRAAVSEGDSERSMRLQRDLVGHAQQLHALRQIATARWERLSAATTQLARLPGASASDLADTRRDRALSLLGL
jgi:hypothetical protein